MIIFWNVILLITQREKSFTGKGHYLEHLLLERRLYVYTKMNIYGHFHRPRFE